MNTQPLYVGRKLVVAPPQSDATMKPRAIPIYIDAGAAFGDGAHPTTQLCLQAIERHLKPGTTMIDLGTGTGILSIAAAKLGAQSVLGIDNDAEAVRIAQKNIAANGAVEKIRVEWGSLEQVVAGDFGVTHAPIVVANILTNVLMGFFELGMGRTITPNGMLILSGILRTQMPEIRASLQWHEMRLAAQEQMGDWVCVIAKK